MKTRVITMFTVAAAILAGCADKDSFDATGTFEATTVTVSSEAAGKIIGFSFSEGQKVGTGEMVCEIDSTQFILQRNTLVRQQQALLAGKPDAAKQLSALSEQIKKQQKECDRVESLFKSDAATSKQADDAKAQLSILQSQYEATLSSLSKNSASIEGNIAVLASQIQQADYSIDKCRIASPVDGVILTKYVQEGELAAPGKTLFKVGDLDNMYLRAYFSSDQLAGIAIGQNVKVTADFGGNQRYEYPGIISWIASESEFTPKNIQTKSSRSNLVYAVKIAVKNDGRLKIGMYGEVIL